MTEALSALDPSPSVRAHPPLWIYGCATIAGAAIPFIGVAMPFLLRREGISVETIAGIAAITASPFALMFAWAPLVDMFITRRNWVVTANVASALLFLTALLLPRPQYLTCFTVSLFLSNLASSIALMAIGGMMATSVPDGLRGQSAGWFQAGNFGSFPLLGGGSLWLIERMALVPAAVTITIVSFLPALTILLVDEPPRSLAPNRAVFGAMFREVRVTMSKREVWVGALLVVSPLGGGVCHLFSGLGVDYRASPEMISRVTGLPGGVIAIVAGAFLGGALSDRIARQTSFIFCGGLVAVVSAAIAMSPATPMTFAVGAIAYEAVTAMVWASAYAFYLELSGSDPLTAATRIAIFTSIRVGSNGYMIWVAGVANHTWGTSGMFATDAAIVACTVVACVVAVRTLTPRRA